MEESKLIKKLQSIEALHSGAKTEGEKDAADRARQRILARLQEIARADPPIEFRFALKDIWQKRIFIALLRRYGIQPYRYRGQRSTTVMARVPKKFVNETLWPEFLEVSQSLHSYLSEVTERIVSQVLCRDNSEVTILDNAIQSPEE